MFYSLCPENIRILKCGDSLLMLMSCIFWRVMHYLSFVVEVVDTKFGMKQLYLCDVPMPIHWHLLFLVSFVILQYSSLPGEQRITYSACAKLTIQCPPGFRSSSYPNNLSNNTFPEEV